MNTDELERIRLRCVCDPDDEDTCWLWTGSVTKNNIPTVNRRVDGKFTLMSGRRWVYQFVLGKELKPRDMVVTTCGHQNCLAPAHLKKASRAYVQRQVNDGNHALSAKRSAAIKATLERKGGHKLTPELADIARDTTRRSDEVAAELGISISMVNNIRAGKAWRQKGAPKHTGMTFIATQLAANDSTRRAA